MTKKDRTRQRQALEAIFAAAVEAVDPERAVAGLVNLDGGRLRIARRSYDLTDLDRVVVAGAGKGAAPMARALEKILGPRLDSGLVVVPYGAGLDLETVTIMEAAHPVPDEGGVRAAEALLELLESCTRRDLVIFVLTGGASALLTLPMEPLTLEDLRRTTRVLLGSGADIHRVNALRKHLSRVAGGRLAQAAHPAAVEVLVVSDVVGDSLESIASGPLYPDPGTFGACMEVVKDFGLSGRLPEAVLDVLIKGSQGLVPETPKPGDTVFKGVRHTLAATNAMALEAAKEKARSMGYHAMILDRAFTGEARDVAIRFGALATDILRQLKPTPAPACILTGGETTVTLNGNGLGGRCQEMALAASLDLEDLHQAALLCAGTDGRDGPTDAAGAFAFGDTVTRGGKAGMDAKRFLERNDSYTFFKNIGDLFIIGPTRTNVMDLAILLIDDDSSSCECAI